MRSGTERLAMRLDAVSCFFLFGYYLRALECAAADGRPSGKGAGDAARILARLHETASRSEGLGPFVAEVADVMRLVDEGSKGGGPLEEGLPLLLDRCAKRWFQRVRELPRHRNSLAVDIAFNLELAGLEEISADLYEAMLCLEAGAFRASRLMSARALDKALDKTGATGESLGQRLGRARETGLIASADVRSALANLGGEEASSGDGPECDGDGSLAEWALETALRLAKKLLRQRIEESLLLASGARCDPAGPVR